MNQKTTDFVSYWHKIDDQVSSLSNSTVTTEEINLRSNEFSTIYGLSIKSIDGFSLFAYYSVPKGEGPFPAILMTPSYASVTGVPPLNRRESNIVLAVCARGQRLSNANYQSEFPGLLTDKIDDPINYPYRGISADCLRALDVLVSMDKVDPENVAVVGLGELPLLVSSLRPKVKVVMTETPFLFNNPFESLTLSTDYPLEEYADYLREHPDKLSQAVDTVSLFSPLAHCSEVKAITRISCSNNEIEDVSMVSSLISGETDIYIKTGKGFIDRNSSEDWLESNLRS